MLASNQPSEVDHIRSLLEAFSKRVANLTVEQRDEIAGDWRRLQSLVNDLVEEKIHCAQTEKNLYSANQALAVSEAKYRALTESIQDGLFSINKDWMITYINSRAAQNGGFEPEQLTGRNIWEAFPRLKDTPLAENYQRVMTERTPIQFEMRGAYRDLWYSISIYPAGDGISVYWQDISERKQAEAAFQESQQRLADFLESTQEHIYALDRDWKFTFANQHYCDVCGIQLIDLIGKNFWEVNSRYLGTPIEPHMRTAMEQQVPVHYRAGGMYTPYWFDMSLYPTQEGISVFARDRTDEFRAEQALRESEGRFRSILEGSRDVIYRVNMQTGRYDYISPACEQVVGYTAEELMAQDAQTGLEMIHPDDREAMQTAMARLETADTVEVEYRQRTKKGDYHWLSNRLSVERDESGRPLYRNGNIRDITESKQVEEALRKSEAFLVRSNRKISEILSSIRDDFYVLDRNWLFVYANKQFTGKIGKEPEDFVGNCIWEMFPKHVGSILYENLHASMDKGEIRRFEVGGQYTDAWYSMTSFPSADGITVLGTDITERKRVEAELRSTRLTAEQNLEQLQTILQNMGEGLFVFDGQGNILLINEAMLALSGLDGVPKEDFIKYTERLEIHDPQGHLITPTELPGARALRGETIHNQEYFIQRKDTGISYTALYNAAPILDQNGRVKLVIVTVRDITERKRAEERLAYQAQLLEMVHDAIIATDDQMRITFWNQAAKRLYGWTSQEALAQNASHLFQSELVGLERERALQQAHENGVFDGEVIHHTKDGRRLVIETYTSPQKDASGRIVGYLTANRDATDRKQAEEELQKAFQDLVSERNRLQAVMEALPVGVSILDENGGVFQYNKGFEAVWGGPLPPTSSVEDYGAFRAWSVETGQPLRPEEWASAQAIQKGKTIVGQYLQIQRFDGTKAYVLNSGSPIRNPAGEITGSAVAIMDITQWTEADNALRESQNRFRVAVNTAPLLVYSCDRDQRYTWVYNPLRGFRTEDVLGKRDDEILPPETAAQLVAAKQLALETGQSKVQEVKVPLNGVDTYYLLTTDPNQDKNGNITGLTCSAIDITEQKKADFERQEQAIQLEVQRRLMDQREKDRSSLARDLHDGPIQVLSSVMFQLHMIKESFPDLVLKNELEQVGLDIKNTIHDLRDVLNDLRPPALAQFGFIKVVRMFVEDFRTRYPDIELDVNLAEEDDLLSKETHLTLFRIFQAGINNIIRHSEATKIWVIFKVEQDCFVLELRDNGKGFDPAIDFNRLTRSGHFGLVGMKERAEAIGGEFTVSSEPGKGTTIVVKCPADGII